MKPIVYPTITVGPWHNKYVSEALTELSLLSGREMVFAPTEPTATWRAMDNVVRATPTNMPKIGTLYFGGNARAGTASNHIVFEYGSPRSNVQSYSFITDRSNLATRAFVPRPDFPEPGRTTGAAHSSFTDSTAQTARGRYDTWVDSGGIELATTRAQLAEQHVTLRKDARKLVRFTPVRNATPQPFEDYDIGDTVRFRAVINGVLRYDLAVRIFGITANIDDAGNESVELTTEEDV